jgi:hypothetical protein
MRPVVLFTDFGFDGPYVGQLRLAAHRWGPHVPVFDLMHDAPAFSPIAAGWLLAALVERLPQDAVVCAVIDPGVGTRRRPVILRAGGRLFVGPDNGLLNRVAEQEQNARWWALDWVPERLSASFHGRDLFAPAAVRLAQGDWPDHSPVPAPSRDASGSPAQIIYADGFGNAWTGLRQLESTAQIQAEQTRFRHASTFGDRAPGEPLWYLNSNGFVELAVNQGSAVEAAGLGIGTPVTLDLAPR